MSEEEKLMARAQMNQSWYDTYMTMKRTHKYADIRKHNTLNIDDTKATHSIDKLMEMFDAQDLRKRIFAMQQELYDYHNFLDEIEELKAHNKQLECKTIDLLKERSLQNRSLKKSAYKAVRGLQNKINGLKMELAQSREKEDSHKAKMQTVLNKKKTLEEETRALREKARCMHTTNKICCLPRRQSVNDRIEISKGGLFQILNEMRSEHNAQPAICGEDITEKSSFHRGAVS
eukprot:15360305-Ditylum_brightwellii.AAC.1